MNSKDRYIKKAQVYSRLIEKSNKYASRMAALRLLTILAALVCFYLLYISGGKLQAWCTMAAYAIVFAYLVKKHRKAKCFIHKLTILKDINLQGAKRLDGQWKDFEDTGEEFASEGHAFSGDMDLFGRSSFFQLANTCVTWYGRRALAQSLTQPKLDINYIKDRQEAVKELSHMLWWRQRIQLSGMEVKHSLLIKNNKLSQWAVSQGSCCFKAWQKAIIRTMPVITILSGIMSYGLKAWPSIIFKILIILQAIAIYIGNRKRGGELEAVYSCKESIKCFERMLKRFENTSFSSRYIKNMQKCLKSNRGEKAYEQIRSLEKISDRIANRGNMMFIPINVLFLWDYQCAISLGKWKDTSGTLVENWLNTLGELEGLCSLSNIAHDHTDWCFPTISPDKSIYNAQGLGHPLLGTDMVRNSVDFKKDESVLLITGSNMSGKSTLMRTCGISLVMAYSGGPVCAYKMSCSLMKLYSCMRIGDNLEKSISSFYAELIRIKDIVAASKEGGQVFFLLDEIFKGTNSMDRHTGAKQVILQLLSDGSVGMVSTHDLELSALEDETAGRVRNYHFEEQYKDGQLSFDYRLRKGVSHTRNALYLIRMAGIETNNI